MPTPQTTTRRKTTTRRRVTRRRVTARGTTVKPVTELQTQEMAEYRKEDLNTYNKEIKRSSFPEGKDGDKAYREALLAQYQQIRQTEYRYVVQNEAMKIYNKASDGRVAGVHENHAIWNPEKYDALLNRPQTEQSDSTKQVPIITAGMGINGNNYNRNGAYSCAITATAIQMQIAEEMGHKGEYIQPSKKTPLASAKSAATCVDKKYQVDGKGRTLDQMVSSGELDVGDEVSLRIRNSAQVKTGSGCHSMTIAAVNYDNNGKVKSYILQANNNCTYTTVNIGSGSYYGTKIVNNAAKTHEWINDKIKEEQQQLSNLSNEELAKRVAEAKDKTTTVIDNLQQTEAHAATHSRNGQSYISGISTQYHQDLQDRKQTHYIRQQDPIVLQQTPQEQLDLTLNIPNIYDRNGNVVYKKDQPQTEPTTRTVEQQNQQVDKAQKAAEFRNQRTATLLIDGNKAQQDARADNQRIAAQQQQDQGQTQPEPQIPESIKATEYKPYVYDWRKQNTR